MSRERVEVRVGCLGCLVAVLVAVAIVVLLAITPELIDWLEGQLQP